MKSFTEYTILSAVDYHISNRIPIYENVFRPGTKNHFALIETTKTLYENGKYFPLDEEERDILETDIGKWDIYEGNHVPLDYPMFGITEDSKEELNSPKRGGSKKFYVYVKNPDTGKVKKIEWGDTSGLKLKIDDPEARKSFVARHQCDQKTDKMSAGYWACRTPRYGKQLGLSPSSTGNFFW